MDTIAPLASIGIDIGKDVLHVVGFGTDGKIAFRRKIRRLALVETFRRLPASVADKGDIDNAAWACATTCFANNPNGTDLASLLGEFEIRPETLRYIACATSDLLEDSGCNIEQWLLAKVSRWFRNTVSEAVMIGDGVGKPQGILQPQSGIPICETGAGTPAGQFTWQDLVTLRFEVPMGFWSASSAYTMNQRTAGLLFGVKNATIRASQRGADA